MIFINCFVICSLAVLNSGSLTDSSKELLSKYQDFDINVLRRERGVKLELVNPPEDAFVDGKIIRSLQAKPICCTARYFVCAWANNHGKTRPTFKPFENSAHITNTIFSILRNARALHIDEDPNMIVLLGRTLHQ